MPRWFVALDLPEEDGLELERRCHGLRGARWTRDRQFHLTLRFLGDVPDHLTGEIRAALREVRGAPLVVAVGGVGVFPPRGAPRVLWAGVEGGGALLELQEQIEEAAQLAGLPREPRRFHPHVTLARLSGVNPRELAAYLEANQDLRCPQRRMERFLLYSSLLKPAGAVHAVEESYPLGEA